MGPLHPGAGLVVCLVLALLVGPARADRVTGRFEWSGRGADADSAAMGQAILVIPSGHRAISARAEVAFADAADLRLEAHVTGTACYSGYQVALVRFAPAVSGRSAAGGRACRVRLEVETSPGGTRPRNRQRFDPEQSREIERRLAAQVGNPEALALYAPADLQGPPSPSGRGAAPLPATTGRPSGGFHPSFAPSLAGSAVRYLIVTSAALAPAFQPLADWKTRRGVPAVVRTIEWIESRTRRGSDRAETLRNFLIEAYQLWGVEWVLLGGDTAILPTRYGWVSGDENTCPTDLYYACLDGTWNDDGDELWGEGANVGKPSEADILPEIAVARAPVNNTAEAQLFVGKAIAYERPARLDYQDKALFLGEVLVPARWDSGMAILYDAAPSLQQMIQQSFPAWMSPTRLYDTYWLYPPAAKLSRAATIAAMNAGAGIVNHLGHGYIYSMSVGDVSLSTADADGLTNGERTFLLISANCAAVAFDYNCLAERFLLNPGGGAAAVIGASRSVPATLISWYNAAIHRQLFESHEVHLAELLNAARLERAAIADWDGQDRFVQFALNALGDPEMRVFTGPVRTPTWAHPDTLPLSPDTLQLVVQAGGTPVAGARVCALEGGEVYASALTDSEGAVRLALTPETPGALLLTVSGEDLATRTDTLQIAPAAGPALSLESVLVDDDSSGTSLGDGNGVADAGETLEITPRLRNNGGSPAAGVSGVAAALDPRLLVLQGSFAADSIAPGQMRAAAAPIVVRVSALAPDGAILGLALHMQDEAGRHWDDALPLAVCAPRPEVTRVAPVGVPKATPSRPLALQSFDVEIKNYGSATQPPLVGTLVSLDTTAVVLEDSVAIPATGPMASAAGAAPLVVTCSTIPVRLRLLLQDGYGRTFAQSIDLQPPAKPAAPIPDATFATGAMRLTWTPSADTDRLGYHVFRRLLGTPSFERLTSDLVGHSEFLDTGVQPNSHYEYCLVAVDSSRQWSAPSDTVAVATTAALLPGWPLEMSDPSSSSVGVGDIDGDGKPEFVVADDGLYAWHADGNEVIDGDGDVSTLGVFSTLPGSMNASVALAQFDGQPGLEIVAASWTSNRVYVFDGAGRVLPGWPQEPASSGTVGYWASPAVGDLDGDGSPEVVALSKDSWLYAWHADGTPVLPGGNGALRQLGIWSQTTPALADLDGDGQLEIVVAGTTGYLYAVHPDGTDLPGWPWAVGNVSKSSPAIGDVDGDGNLEIVVTGENDFVHVLRANATELPGWPRSAPMDAPDLGPSPALGDLNGDGRLEIVLVAVKNPFNETQLLVYDWQGNVLLAKPLENYAQSSPILADLDGDGSIDIVHGGEAGILHAWKQSGEELEGFPIPLGDFIRGTPVYCDLDGDGLGDLALAGWDRRAYVWAMHGVYRPDRAPWPTFHGDMARTGRLHLARVSPVPEPPPRELTAVWAPNPFNPAVRLRYTVPGAGGAVPVRVDLFDTRGRRLRRLVDAPRAPGVYNADWDGRDAAGRVLASGVYFYRLHAGRQSLTGKLTLLR